MSEKTEVKKETREINAKFAETNKEFLAACDLVGIKPTTRQASKYRNKKGKAFKGIV